MYGSSCRCLKSSKFKKYLIKFIRYESTSKKVLSTSEKFDFEFSKTVEKEYKEKLYTTKSHPGVMSVSCIQLPTTLMDAVQTLKEELGYHESSLNSDARELVGHIYRRQPPFEAGEIRETANLIASKLVNKGKLSPKFIEENNELSVDDMTKEEKSRFETSLRSHVYNWHPMKFDDYLSFVYLWGRLAPDYAALVRVFNEIKQRRPDFTPRTLFDFGSGVGSVTWAVDTTWPDTIKETYNVDTSASMNNIADKLLRGGREQDSYLKLGNFYFRQFLPASDSMKYDLVVSSRTLFELGDLKDRAKTTDILWKKVNPGGFLIFVETGSHCSYKMLMELRDYLLEISKIERVKYGMESPIHVFAPCPHDEFCPRFYHASKSSCHFSVLHNSLLSLVVKTEKFSYVIFQKENRNEEEERWPRVVQPLLRRHHHVISRTCTPAGAIREFVVTKSKHGSSCYQICKKCKWGDLLPINIHDDVPGNNTEGIEETTFSQEEENPSSISETESIEEGKVL